MVADRQRIEILEGEGFLYHPIKMIYINREKKKIFSYEAIEDNPETWIHSKIAEESDRNTWQFYFNEEPSDNIKQKILEEIK